MNLNDFDKILVCGISGAGKTTMAKQISKKFGHTPIYMDEHFWMENWTRRPEDEFYRRVDKLSENSRWILDGAVRKVISRYCPKSDIVIWLNFSRTRAIYRVMKRLIQHRGKKIREEMPDGCIERFDLNFIRWIWNYPKNHNNWIRNFFKENSVKFIEVKSVRMFNELLQK